MDSDPPLNNAYKTLHNKMTAINGNSAEPIVFVEECDLPVIDLGLLSSGEAERDECKAQIARASREWGFFQVVNHGISFELTQKMKSEQEKAFKEPFENKYKRFSPGCYRWGAPTATCLKQLSWSEAFHVPLNTISDSNNLSQNSLSSTLEDFAVTTSSLALKLAEILAEELGHGSGYFRENCLSSTCYLRMNRYPPCPEPSEVYGLMPHTDSNFLTILLQYNVGGLQLVNDGTWFAVKPNPKALIVNIGDLFQAWSNDVYKSVEHRVVVNPKVERFSTAYFLCPSFESVIESCSEPSAYRKFSFGEFRQQVQKDVTNFGFKVGLSRFLL